MREDVGELHVAERREGELVERKECEREREMHELVENSSRESVESFYDTQWKCHVSSLRRYRWA